MNHYEILVSKASNSNSKHQFIIFWNMSYPFLRLIFSLTILIAPVSLFASYTPNATTYLYGGNPADLLFSSGGTPWVWPSPEPVRIDAGYIIHGDVWTDAIGWSQFDHGVAGSEAKFDVACMTGAAITCPLRGYLWSSMAGWIELEWQGITYTKTTWLISWNASSTTVGSIPFNSELWAMPVTLSGAPLTNIAPFSDYTFATNSVTLRANVPAWILTRGTTVITMQLCPVGYPALCRNYTYNLWMGGFPNVDLSLATDYTYTITDPFGSTTTGTIKVYAANVSQVANVTAGTLLTTFCIPANLPNPLCPDGSTPKTTWAGWDFASPLGSKFADAVQKFNATINLRDIYGNPLKTEGAIGRNVTYSVWINSTAVTNTLFGNPLAYGRSDIAGQTNKAYRFYDSITEINPNATPLPFTNAYTPGRSFSLSSYAPTTAWDPNVLGNSINIWNVSVDISWPNTHSANITAKFQTTDIAFLPLYRVTGIIGLSGQIGRPTTITGAIQKTDPSGESSNAHIIHGLSIVTTVGWVANVASTFQDITGINPIEDCFAHLPSGWSYGVSPYCDRGISGGWGRASMISIPTSGSGIHSFTTTPRRVNTVDIEQSYAYDSIITYRVGWVGWQVIIYQGLSQATVAIDKVYAGGVKILGQSSGDKIFQSITDMYQPKNASITRANILNEIRKNVSILTRNATYTASAYTWENLIVYTWSQNLNAVQLNQLDNKASIIVYGDISIGSNYTLPNTQTPPRAIMALRDSSGNGGNIYIKNTVSRLDVSLIAEWSLISGDPATDRYYTDLSNATWVLDKQLYVFGSIVSLNTIGWASIPGAPVCPQSIDWCNLSSTIPLRYDFEHFRYYRGASPAVLARSALELSAPDKKAWFIIEYDSRIVSDPPPGLAPIR